MMGLFGKRQKSQEQRDFVEFKGDNTQLLFVADVGASFRRKATVIVPPTHVALIVKNGSITNVCSAGEFPLYSANGKVSPENAVRTLKIVYISKTVKVPVLWGTKMHQRIEYVDPKVGPVSVGAFGRMEVKVCNAQKFYQELVASFGDTFTTEDLQERIGTRVLDDTVRVLGRILNEKKLSYYDFAAEKFAVQEQVERLLSDRLTDQYGVEVCEFIIENINIPPEQEEKIRSLYLEDNDYDRDRIRFERREEIKARERAAVRREKEELRGDADLDDFIYKRQRDRAREEEEYARRNRHEDEDRAWAREDKKAEAEAHSADKYMDTMRDVEISRSEAMKAHAQAAPAAAPSGKHCPACGASYDPNARYCPVCGAELPRKDVTVKCAGCGMEIPWGTAFCPYCGFKAGDKRGR